ncbi:MAG: hypothetical protein NW214_10430 [Pseudanabaenaceae cyanobacterium bins.39]|nr:hypothetical protein [Pseudanabaenaceae cyanobacterium bins.39]
MNRRSLLQICQRYAFYFCLWLGSLLLCLILTNGVIYGQERTFELRNRASGTYNAPGANVNASSELNRINGDRLIDPLGQILDCGGQEFADYTGFTVSVYENAGNGELGALVALTPTNLPGGLPPEGIAPNLLNNNPYALTNAAVSGRRGVYNFLLDVTKGQTTPGRSYILVVNAPVSLGLIQRRVLLRIDQVNNDVLSYIATSLDGRPIGVDGVFTINGSVLVKNAANIPLSLVALQLNAAMCEQKELQVIKTGDRAAAEPGDVAIYRLAMRNLTKSAVRNPVVSDILPLGFNYVPNSARATIAGNPVGVVVTANGSSISFALQAPIPAASDSAFLVYAVSITPDAVRGSGRNAATLSAIRNDNNATVRDGPSIFTMRIRPGIISDCGTLIGRVFVDKNFDGEQQNGEPGVPNAVIFMDDGNRIVTDANGVYSMANVIPGVRSVALDISSLPGYTLAPNLYFIERNSQSRLVRLSPGSLSRANFGVTPAFRGVEQKP